MRISCRLLLKVSGVRAAIYCRVSTDGQTAENQRQVLEEAALRRGWSVVQVYTDNGISGAKGRGSRPSTADQMPAAFQVANSMS